MTRIKSIVLLNLQLFFLEILLKFTYILFPTHINIPFDLDLCKPANKHKNYIHLQIITLNKHETLATANDFLNCSHKNKYLFMVSSLSQ